MTHLLFHFQFHFHICNQVMCWWQSSSWGCCNGKTPSVLLLQGPCPNITDLPPNVLNLLVKISSHSNICSFDVKFHVLIYFSLF